MASLMFRRCDEIVGDYVLSCTIRDNTVGQIETNLGVLVIRGK